MTEGFEALLKAAQQNDEQALTKLLAMYDPLLESRCYVNGARDEDLKQYLSMRFIAAVKKFDEHV